CRKAWTASLRHWRSRRARSARSPDLSRLVGGVDAARDAVELVAVGRTGDDEAEPRVDPGQRADVAHLPPLEIAAFVARRAHAGDRHPVATLPFIHDERRGSARAR